LITVDWLSQSDLVLRRICVSTVLCEIIMLCRLHDFNHGIRTSFDEAMVNLIELIQHILHRRQLLSNRSSYLLLVKPTRLRDLVVRNHHYQCQRECESLSMLISDGSINCSFLNANLKKYIHHAGSNRTTC